MVYNLLETPPPPFFKHHSPDTHPDYVRLVRFFFLLSSIPGMGVLRLA